MDHAITRTAIVPTKCLLRFFIRASLHRNHNRTYRTYCTYRTYRNYQIILHLSRKKEFKDWLNPCSPCGFIVLGAFSLEITQILSRLPTLFPERVIQKSSIGDRLLRLFRSASLFRSDV